MRGGMFRSVAARCALQDGFVAQLAEPAFDGGIADRTLELALAFDDRLAQTVER